MTQEELKEHLRKAGFKIVPRMTKEGEYYAYRKGDIVVSIAKSAASAWEAGGRFLVPYTYDLEEVKRVIDKQ